MVEHLLAKQKVESSILSTRSNFWLDYDVFYIYNNDYIIGYYFNNCCEIFSLFEEEYYAQ